MVMIGARLRSPPLPCFIKESFGHPVDGIQRIGCCLKTRFQRSNAAFQPSVFPQSPNTFMVPTGLSAVVKDQDLLPTHENSINAKSCAQLQIAWPQVLTKNGLQRTETTPKKGAPASGVSPLVWEGEAPAEPNPCQATACPRLGGSLALPG